MKKIFSIVTTIALFGASFVPTMAAGNNCDNGTTGPFSTNYCDVTNNSSVSVNNVNDAQINNVVNSRANTGGNSTSYNTLGGTITTGQASLNSTVSSVANVNTTTVSGGPAASGNTGANDITGPESDNRISITNSRTVGILNSNTASVNNTVNTTADTGNNRGDFNTGPASVTTGNATLRTTVATHANDNATAVTAGAGGTGGNLATNDTTGPFSSDYVTIGNSSSVGVNNVNDMIVNNLVNALSNTGMNSASFTTLGGSIHAGNSSAIIGVNTEGNINTTTVDSALGGFLNDSGNVVTGPMSDNRTTLLNNQNIVVDNWNNKCLSHNAPRLGCDPADLGINNIINDVVDSGNNNADYNTGPGGVVAGISDLVKSVLTHLNDSMTVIHQ